MILQNDFKRQWKVVEESVLHAVGLVARSHYPRLICDQGALQQGTWTSATDPVNARRFVSCELSLPIHPFLTEQEVDTVIAACNAWKI
jgi:dTDP-4-amino-4,6-dideoxygalactose transaminase